MADLNKCVLITGIAGCGRSSILKMVRAQLPELKFLNFGEIMLDIFALQGNHRDTLRKLSHQQQQTLAIQASKRIMSELNELTVIETKALIKTPGGYFPAISQKIIDYLSPVAIIVIEADPEIIYQRRQTSTDRVHDFEKVHEIATHQELNRSFVMACSAITSAAVCFIDNSDSIETSTHLLREHVNLYSLMY